MKKKIRNKKNTQKLNLLLAEIELLCACVHVRCLISECVCVQMLLFLQLYFGHWIFDELCSCCIYKWLVF